jgi:hypothetical protein
MHAFIQSLKRGLVCALLLACGAAAADKVTSPEDEEMERLAKEASVALWWGDFAKLQQLHDAWSQPGQKLLGGETKLRALRRGIDRAMRPPDQGADLFFTELQALTRAWAREHPRSGLAHALHALALIEHAWSIRGRGYSRTVPPQAWADFNRLITQASEYLAEQGERGLGSTLSHGALLTAGRALGWRERQVWAVVEDGTRRNPDDLDLYRLGLGGLLPKWHGDEVTVDRYIGRVVERTRDAHGLSMYARLYASASYEEFEHRLFEDSGARWDKMAQGWRDLLARHPTRTTENRYAYFACLARDKPVLLELLERIGDTPELDEWGSNSRRTFDTCKRWAQQQ